MNRALTAAVLSILFASQSWAQGSDAEIRYVVPNERIAYRHSLPSEWQESQTLSDTLDEINVVRILDREIGLSVNAIAESARMTVQSASSTVKRLVKKKDATETSGTYIATLQGAGKKLRPYRILLATGVHIRDAWDGSEIIQDENNLPAFSIPSDVALIGGLTLNEVDSKTILSGQMAVSGKTGWDKWRNRYRTVVEVLGTNVSIANVCVHEGSAVYTGNPVDPAWKNGGGIFVRSKASASIFQSEIAGNYAQENGAGIYNAGFLKLDSCTIAGNGSGKDGAGIFTASEAKGPPEVKAGTTYSKNTIVSHNVVGGNPQMENNDAGRESYVDSHNIAGALDPSSNGNLFRSLPEALAGLNSTNLTPVSGPLDPRFLTNPIVPSSLNRGRINDLRLQRSSVAVNRGTNIPWPSLSLMGKTLTSQSTSALQNEEAVSLWRSHLPGPTAEASSLAGASTPTYSQTDEAVVFNSEDNQCLQLDGAGVIGSQEYTIIAVAQTNDWMRTQGLISNWHQGADDASSNKNTSVFLGFGYSAPDGDSKSSNFVRVNDEYKFELGVQPKKRFILTATRSSSGATAWLDGRKLKLIEEDRKERGTDRKLETPWFIGRQGNHPDISENWNGKIHGLFVFSRVLNDWELEIAWSLIGSKNTPLDLFNSTRVADNLNRSSPFKGRIDIGCYEYPFDSEERYFAIRPDKNDNNKVNIRRPSDSNWPPGSVTLRDAFIAARNLNGPTDDPEEAYANDISEIRLVSGDYDLNEEFEVPSNIAIRGGFNEKELYKSVEKRTGKESKISGGGKNRLFKINNALDISLDHLFLKKGNTQALAHTTEATASPPVTTEPTTQADDPAPAATDPATPPEPVINRNGGAILITQDGNALTTKGIDLNYLAIHSCKAEQGGAIWSGASDVSLRNCTIVGNHATQAGSGVFVKSESQLTARHCVLILNNGPYEKATGEPAAWGASNIEGNLSGDSTQNVYVYEKETKWQNTEPEGEKKDNYYHNSKLGQNFAIPSKDERSQLGFAIGLPEGRWLHGTFAARDVSDIDGMQYGPFDTTDDLSPTRIAPFHNLITTSDGEPDKQRDLLIATLTRRPDEQRDLRGTRIVPGNLVDVGAFQYVNDEPRVIRASNSVDDLETQIAFARVVNSDGDVTNDVAEIVVEEKNKVETVLVKKHELKIEDELSISIREIFGNNSDDRPFYIDGILPPGIRIDDELTLSGKPTIAGELKTSLFRDDGDRATRKVIKWVIRPADAATAAPTAEDANPAAPAIELPPFVIIRGNGSDELPSRVPVVSDGTSKMLLKIANSRGVRIEGLAFACVSKGTQRCCIKLTEATENGWRSGLNVTDCKFSDWTERAIFARGMLGSNRPPFLLVSHCEFERNRVNGSGGGVHVLRGHATVSDSFMRGNHSTVNGAAAELQEGSLSVERCTFVSNASGKRGALFAGKSSNLVLTKCTLAYNKPNQLGTVVVFAEDPGVENINAKLAMMQDNLFVGNVFKNGEEWTSDVVVATTENQEDDPADYAPLADVLKDFSSRSNYCQAVFIGPLTKPVPPDKRAPLEPRFKPEPGTVKPKGQTPAFLARADYFGQKARVRTMPPLSNRLEEYAFKGSGTGSKIIPFVHGRVFVNGSAASGEKITITDAKDIESATLTDAHGRFVFRQVNADDVVRVSHGGKSVDVNWGNVDEVEFRRP